MPASRMTWRPAAVADVEDPRDEPAGPRDERASGLDGEARRPAVRRAAAQQRRQLAREAPGRGRRLAERADGEAAADVEGVERLDRSAPERGERQRLAGRASRHASMAPSWDPTCRWMPRGRSGADPPAPPPASMASPISDLGHAELGAARPDREPRQRLRRHVRVEPVSTSIGGAPARRASPGEGRRPRRPTRGPPSASGAPSAAARTAARRSAGVLPIPSSVIRAFGTPARRASVHSPRDTTFAPNPRSRDRRDHGRDVVRLDRVLADDRVGERGDDRRACRVERREVRDVRGGARTGAPPTAAPPAMTGSRSSSFSRGPRCGDDASRRW